MKYRLMVDMSFDKLEDAQSILDLIKAKGKFQVNSVTKEQEGHINFHKCYHDETPTKPCEKIEEIKVR